MKKAFSLIELSIVVLIIGILIAGVTQGSRLINKARLNTARNKTQNSDVASIRGLSLWLEPTSIKSFDDIETEESSPITTWYDINPQNPNGANATQSTVDSKPTYVLDSETSLPVVNFDGTDDYFTLPDGTIPYGDSKYTVFLLINCSSCTTGEIISSGSIASADQANSFRYANGGFSQSWSSNDLDIDSSATQDTWQLVMFTYDRTNRVTYLVNNNFWITIGGDGSTDRASLRTNNGIGARLTTTPIAQYLNANIAEIIIFDRTLKDEETQSIIDYLSDKWSL